MNKENITEEADRAMGRIPMPWEHSIVLSVARITSPIDDESVEIGGLLATCTCRNFQFRFPEYWTVDMVSSQSQNHLNEHPRPPLAIAGTGRGNVVLVMAVPGPTDDPVHMSISVPESIYNDPDALGSHLGIIGSTRHFRRERYLREQETIRSREEKAQCDTSDPFPGIHVVDVSDVDVLFAFLDSLLDGVIEGQAAKEKDNENEPE